MDRIAAITVAAALAMPAVAAAEDAPISNGATLDHHLAARRAAGGDRAEWVNPYVARRVEENDASGSGDAVLARAVAPYTRERLDAGGWQNRLMRDEHYACGNPMLRVAPGQGVTTSEVRIALAAAR